MEEEKKRILTMLQDGKITAETAYKILEELEQSEKENEQKGQLLKNELSADIKEVESAGKKEEQWKQNIQSSKDKVMDFIESAVKKIKEVDLDFNFGKSVDVSHIFQFGPQDLSKVLVDIANGKTEIVAWDQQEVRIECRAKVYRMEDLDEARETFLKNTKASLDDGSLLFRVREKSIKVETTIYVPDRLYEEIEVRIFNGSIGGKRLNAEKLKAKTANGAIKLQEVTGEDCELETGNGAIELGSSTYGKLEAETLNGTIHIDGSFEKADVQSFSGQVHLLNKKTDCESMKVRTTTGKIQMFLPVGTPVSGELKTNLGGFTVNVEGISIIEEKSESLQKVMRFKTAKEPQPQLHISADSKTGQIVIT
ncbi:DUF4097 family beta strand repeat-containing protein [Bacillus massiliglaciei]|uniref:DUF4097 family beta strand repeat-containing protein n=1 Tax=Bacillus massiliglaciei TaxID=1816693 RepID=UPI000A6BE007|nr:DUF4097 domain-containing protein [Bacillus massiliglaciei]